MKVGGWRSWCGFVFLHCLLCCFRAAERFFRICVGVCKCASLFPSSFCAFVCLSLWLHPFPSASKRRLYFVPQPQQNREQSSCISICTRKGVNRSFNTQLYGKRRHKTLRADDHTGATQHGHSFSVHLFMRGISARPQSLSSINPSAAGLARVRWLGD